MTAHATSPALQDEPIRVFLVDDHEHVLWGLRKLIEGEWPRLTLIGTAKSAAEAHAALQRRPADVVVLDLFLGDADCIGDIPRLRATGARVVVLTGSRDGGLHHRALLQGAGAVVLKDDPASVLLLEIERHRTASQSRPAGATGTAEGQ